MLPTDAQERKQAPVFLGCLKYFPLALFEIAKLSKRGNDQHSLGTEVHWDRSKSTDELDALTRHLLDVATAPDLATEIKELTAVAWRACAALQKACEKRASSEDADKQRVEALKHRLGNMDFKAFPGEP